MTLIGNFSTLFKIASIVALTLTLSACKDLFRPSIATICEENPNLCVGLNTDAWCRAEKAEIIRNRYDNLNSNQDTHLYALLKHLETYEICIEKAAQIRHIKYRDKEADRMQGYLTALAEQKRISAATRESKDPYLQYYHWSRHGDEDAKNRFMAQANQGKFNSSDLWIKVASVHLKRDNPMARKALYQALSFYDDADDVVPEVFESLITVNLDDERYASAYVWASVYAHIHEQGDEALARTKPLTRAQLNMDELDDIAGNIEDAIDDGEFNADRLGLWRLN